MATAGQEARYRIRRRLASGGMAEVTLAEDTVLGRPVALKRLRSAGDAGAVARLRREALVGASLSHPNLVSVYDVWEEADGDLVIVMEYVAGDTLRDLIRGHGRLAPERALPILAGVAAALEAVHAQGIVHRDVKPANILLGRDGQVKLADLGIAAVEDNTRITTSGEVVGTFRYMAPEQLEGQRSSPAMDVYALAAVAFEALSGEKARGEPNPLALAHAIATQPPPDLREHWPDAPAAAATVLQRGMAADPTARPRSASELVGRLRAALEPDTTEADAVAEIAAAAEVHRPPRIAQASRTAPRRRRPAPVVLAISALLIAVAAVVVIVGSGSDSPSRSGSGSGSRSASGSGSGSAAKTHAGSPRRSATTKPGSAARGTPTRTASATPAPASSTPASGTSTPPATGLSGGSTPSGAVQAFYERSAHHDYAGAWSLADDTMRGQLGGYASFRAQMSRVRSITFHEATPQSTGASSATVAVRTTSSLADRTEECSGTARTVRTGGSWVLDGISISCSPA